MVAYLRLSSLSLSQVKLQTFDRVGWMLQQFLKMGCSPAFVPGIGPAYLVIDADTVGALIFITRDAREVFSRDVYTVTHEKRWVGARSNAFERRRGFDEPAAVLSLVRHLPPKGHAGATYAS
jgi:hypothetical protein